MVAVGAKKFRGEEITDTGDVHGRRRCRTEKALSSPVKTKNDSYSVEHHSSHAFPIIFKGNFCGRRTRYQNTHEEKYKGGDDRSPNKPTKPRNCLVVHSANSQRKMV